MMIVIKTIAFYVKQAIAILPWGLEHQAAVFPSSSWTDRRCGWTIRRCAGANAQQKTPPTSEDADGSWSLQATFVNAPPRRPPHPASPSVTIANPPFHEAGQRKLDALVGIVRAYRMW